MPNYKKVKRHRRKLFKKNNDIYMQSSDSIKRNNGDTSASSFRVIMGKKERIRNRNIIVASVTFFLVAVIFLISALSPTGLAEGFANYFSGISLRSYFPSYFDGNELYSLGIKNKHFYTLSNQTLSSYNLNGKELFEYNHGFENPIVSLSETRALLYDQNGTSLSVFNANEKILSLDTEYPIYSADITRNGYFVVASKAQSYTSAVTVYDNDGNFVYEWFSPEEIITCVALSPNGKQLAISSVKSVNGVFVSNVCILMYDSVEPVWKQTYNNTFVSALISDFNKYFCVVSQNKCDFVTWKDHSITSYNTENDIKMVRNDSKNTIICEPRSADDSHNKFTVYSKKNKLVTQFDFVGYIDDFAFKNNYLFVLSGNDVYCINKKGEIVKSAECAFGTIRIVPSSNNSVIAVSDNSLTEIHFN